jgi:hypothetical protein
MIALWNASQAPLLNALAVLFGCALAALGCGPFFYMCIGACLTVHGYAELVGGAACVLIAILACCG